MSNCIVNWICLLFNVECIEDIILWLKWFTVVLLAKTKTQKMICTFDNLQKKCKDNYRPLSCKSMGDGSFSDIDKDLCETPTGKSLLYYKFVNIKEKIKCNMKMCNAINEAETNEYKCEE